MTQQHFPTLRNVSRDLPSDAQGFALGVNIPPGVISFNELERQMDRIGALGFCAEAAVKRGRKLRNIKTPKNAAPLTLSGADGYRVAPCEFPGRPSASCATPLFVHLVRCSNNVSGLEEKEIYIALGIDAGHWTRIMKGEAHFPINKLNEFCDLIGNEVPLIWWAHSRGKGLHLLETESERQLKAEREARIRAEEKLAYAEALLTGKKG